MADLMIGDQHRRENVALCAHMFESLALIFGYAIADFDVREDALEITKDAAEESHCDRTLDLSGLRSCRAQLLGRRHHG